MTRQEIENSIPHRDPFLFVTCVERISEDQTEIVASYTVKGDEPFLAGHFPGNPIMPGNLIVEALAQTGGILISTNTQHKHGLGLLAGVDGFRFRRIVRPGDKIKLEVKVLRLRDNGGKFFGRASVDDQLVTKGEIFFIIQEES